MYDTKKGERGRWGELEIGIDAYNSRQYVENR